MKNLEKGLRNNQGLEKVYETLKAFKSSEMPLKTI
jgi:hypothetical protein